MGVRPNRTPARRRPRFRSQGPAEPPKERPQRPKRSRLLNRVIRLRSGGVMRSEETEANAGQRQAQEGVVHVRAPIRSQPQPSVAMQPRKEPFDRPTILPQPAPVRRPSSSEHRFDVPTTHPLAVRLRVVGSIFTQSSSGSNGLDIVQSSEAFRRKTVAKPMPITHYVTVSKSTNRMRRPVTHAPCNTPLQRPQDRSRCTQRDDEQNIGVLDLKVTRRPTGPGVFLNIAPV